MVFNRLNPHAPDLIFFTPVTPNKLSTTRNVPYAHQRLDSILELCLTFPIATSIFWSSESALLADEISSDITYTVLVQIHFDILTISSNHTAQLHRI